MWSDPPRPESADLIPIEGEKQADLGELVHPARHRPTQRLIDFPTLAGYRKEVSSS
jgi:hypothetical protein